MTKFTLLKTILLALTLVGSNVVWGAEVEFIFANQGYTNGQEVPSGTINSDLFFTAATGGTNTAKYYDTGTGLRVYSSGSFTITPQNGATVTNITLTFAGSTYTFNTADANPTVWTGSSSTNVTFSVTRTSRLQKINITYTPASSTAASTPNISAIGNLKATDNYFNIASITLSSTTDGASIYYTTNGDVPTITSTLYSAPFDITSTTTIKAIAVKTGLDNSGISEKTITISVSKPIATQATSVSASGFTANWDAVPAATEYELRVVSKTITGTPAADLFFSEYIEGSSNNKAIEIYNGTGTDVDLSAYTVETYANGLTTVENTLTLSGILLNNDVYVICNSGANSAIKDASDISSTVTFYNGDDALVLKKNGTILDIIGKIGEDPGTEWTATGSFSTLDKTLVRKSSVVTGVSVNPSAGFPALETEWDLYNQDVSTNLGAHTFSSMTVTEIPLAGSPFTVTGENSKTFIGLDANKPYYYKVIAKNGSAVSAVSNEISVTTSTTTALTNPTQNFQLRSINGSILFNSTSGKLVNIYNSLGQKVLSTTTNDGLNSISVGVRGVVFVKIGSEISKLIVE